MSESYYPSKDIKTYEQIPDRYKKQFSPFGEGFVRREAHENYMDAQSSLTVLWWTLFHKRALSVIAGVREFHYPDSIDTLSTTADC